MHDPTEYPGFARQHVWYVDEQWAAGVTIYSPVFDLDRGMGVSDATVPRPPHAVAPTGATAAGRNADLRRPIPIGNRLIVHLGETESFALTAPTFQVFGSCDEGVNPIVEVPLTAAIAIPTGGTAVLLDTVVGFPYVQVRIVNGDGEATVTVCGAVRLSPF